MSLDSELSSQKCQKNFKKKNVLAVVCATTHNDALSIVLSIQSVLFCVCKNVDDKNCFKFFIPRRSITSTANMTYNVVVVKNQSRAKFRKLNQRNSINVLVGKE